jgi:hypothetical protein
MPKTFILSGDDKTNADEEKKRVVLIPDTGEAGEAGEAEELMESQWRGSPSPIYPSPGSLRPSTFVIALVSIYIQAVR